MPLRKSKKFRQVWAYKVQILWNNSEVRGKQNRILQRHRGILDLIFWPGSQARVLVVLCGETAAESGDCSLVNDRILPGNSHRFRPRHWAAFPWPQSTLNQNADRNLRKKIYERSSHSYGKLCFVVIKEPWSGRGRIRKHVPAFTTPNAQHVSENVKATEKNRLYTSGR
jgi:hypothetical protein